MTVLFALHILGAVVWVGGLFFIYFALRPAVLDMDLADRLGLWRKCLDNFFPWLWGAIAALLGSGYGLIIAFPDEVEGTHVVIMQVLGWIMILIFGHTYFSPYRLMGEALDRGDTNGAARQIEKFRLTLIANLALGLITVLVGTTGRFWD